MRRGEKMTENHDIERAFSFIQEAIALLQPDLNDSYFESYLENIENLIDHGNVRVVEGIPDLEKKEKLVKIYKEFQRISLSGEEKRRLLQLLILAGLRAEPMQANHQLTPDSIGFLFVYLLEELYPNKQKEWSILDPVVGTGNLLYTVYFNLKLAGYQHVTTIGIESDELLLSMAAANKEFLQANALLLYQDAVQTQLAQSVNAVIADLPIGYYPNDEVAKKFLVASQKEHTYAHHLLMEKSMDFVDENGFGLFLLPSHFLETEQASLLKKWLTEKVYLQGIIHLPQNLFKNEQSRKSIVIVQNRGSHSKQAKEVLIAELSNLKEIPAVQKFFKQFNEWKQTNLEIKGA